MACASVLMYQSLYPACWLQMPNVFIYHEADLGWMLLEKCPLFKMSLSFNRLCIILAGILAEVPEWRGWMEGCHSSQHCCLGWVSGWVGEREWVGGCPNYLHPHSGTQKQWEPGLWQEIPHGDFQSGNFQWQVDSNPPNPSQPSNGHHLRGFLPTKRASRGWSVGKRALSYPSSEWRGWESKDHHFKSSRPCTA